MTRQRRAGEPVLMREVLPVIVLGVLLIAIPLLLLLGTVFFNSQPADLEIFGQMLTGMSVEGVLITAFVAGLLTATGLWLVLKGLKRKRNKSVSRKREVSETRSQVGQRQEENERLAAELAEQREAQARTSSAPVFPHEGEERTTDAAPRR